MYKQEDKKELERKNAASEAVKHINNNDVVGLGTGSTAVYAIQLIAELVKQGLTIKGVPTSEKSALLATQLGLELIDINDISSIDVTIDGADEFDSARQLIKGGGGALFREKIVASLSKKEIIIADSGKFVERLGKFKVPIEVVPIAVNYVQQQILRIEGKGTLRETEHVPFITDNGNYIIDADFGLISDPASLAQTLNQIDGILAHGLFINLATIVIMGQGTEVRLY
ncbi:MAG: Ribose 5-phosphate isomerase [Pedobacter sp.]|nr:Ribose 5-phosphate isomerase [Pedobacter sp.]